MDFAFNDRQLRLNRLYRELGLRHERRTDSRAFDWHAWQAVTEAGLWRLPLTGRRCASASDGARFDAVAAFEGLTSAMRSIGFAMAVANQLTLIDGIVSFGTPEQQDALLPRLLDGEPGATAISESGTGTEIRALQTRLIDDVDGYRLDGHKHNISLAPHALLALVAARYDGGAHPQTALALIDTAAAGVYRSAPKDTLGVHDLPIGELTFDAVHVAPARLLGATGDGLRTLMRIASMNRAYFALICSAAVQPFLADALAYAAERRILGVAIDTHQHIQRRLVDIRLRAERSRWTALAAIDQLLGEHPTALECASIAKIAAAHDLTQSALDLLALHGSDGYRNGSVSAFVADALAMISAGGTEEMHRRNVFAQMQRRRDQERKRPADRETLDRPAPAPATAGDD